ncbi:phage-associated protein, BcepMu gp16 family [Moraxella caprae]|uniref:Phage-associated protein, BcepMu gp16 family n=1 Tax=Moraxella caprae TaxID=90240 RepID=A0A378R3D4_9GAMM|nr:DNA-binding protein [Moraxella caprae]STZ09299.1 phage-associated protein, BcepMu gp16 family [Moraxella caprae]
MAKTVEQLKAEFATEGKTFVSWANERGYDPTYVSRILNGSIQANYGKAHKIAVELGLKQENSDD